MSTDVCAIRRLACGLAFVRSLQSKCLSNDDRVRGKIAGFHRIAATPKFHGGTSQDHSLDRFSFRRLRLRPDRIVVLGRPSLVQVAWIRRSVLEIARTPGCGLRVFCGNDVSDSVRSIFGYSTVA